MQLVYVNLMFIVIGINVSGVYSYNECYSITTDVNGI